MSKTLHGKVHGRTIELDEAPGVAEGQEVEVQMSIVETAPIGPTSHQPWTGGNLRNSWRKIPFWAPRYCGTA